MFIIAKRIMMMMTQRNYLLHALSALWIYRLPVLEPLTYL